MKHNIDWTMMMNSNKKAFTASEMLVLISIIALLSGLSSFLHLARRTPGSGTNPYNNARSPAKKKLLPGAASVTGNILNCYFTGKMDWVILSKRLWTHQETEAV